MTDSQITLRLPLPAARAGALIVGLLGVLGYMILVVETTGLGLAVSLVGAFLAVALGCVLRPSLSSLASVSLLAVLFLLLGIFNLCASACGGFAYYDSIGIMSVAGLGILYHGSMVGLSVLVRQMGLVENKTLVLAWIPGIGASLFFAILMASGGHWCSTCAAVHVLMALQLVLVFRALYGSAHLLTGVAGVIAVAGLVNAVFHHRIPTVINDPAELLAYLRSERTAIDPVAVIARDGDQRLPHWHIQIEDSESPDALTESDHRSTPVVAAPSGAARSVRHMGSWGRADAPLILRAIEDPLCPACRESIIALGELRDLVDAGIVRIELDFVYATSPTIDPRAQAAAYLIYAAGMSSGDALIDTALRVITGIRGAVSVPEVAHLIDPSIAEGQLEILLSTHREAIQTRIADNFVRAQRTANGVTPFLSLIDAQSNAELVSFNGHRGSDVLRFAITARQL